MFGERRTLVMLALGFSAGLPFFLVFDTLSAWLRDDGLSLEVIGYFSLATLVYSGRRWSTAQRFRSSPAGSATGAPGC
jgi:PAT family beta-lactamase induction signal transducer AmpG